MRKLASARKNVGIAALFLLVLSLGVTVAVFVPVPASASSPTSATATTTTPAARYLALNGTVSAASDHEILGSSAFPNYATGAVDNYYSLARSHVDNSPFAEGLASPADTGPIGQTAAAGNAQQPQYADARWPGKTGSATYGNKGGPYAASEASEYKATAEAAEASSGLSAPSGSGQMATPNGFNGRLRTALAAWKAKWQGRLGLKPPAAPVAPPTATVTTPIATVTTPTLPTAGLPAPPPVTVPWPGVPPGIVPGSAPPSRSLSSASSPGDGASQLESSTLATLEPKTDALVTRGESRLGRVIIGGGQIVLEGIHVTASITNDGTPTEKAAVSVGAAAIGGVPVTIDQDGVHVAGQGQGLPYQQASDALNGALKQAGIQLFLVAPEITTGDTCASSGGDKGTTTTTATPTPPVPSSSGPSDTSCPSSSGDTGMTTCPSPGGDQGTATTTTSPLPQPGTGTTKTTTTTTTTTSSSSPTDNACPGASGDTGTSSCPSSSGKPGTTTTTSSSGQTDTTTTPNPIGDSGTAGDATDSSKQAVRATGVHVVFTQPVEQSGVPAQYVHHILGEVFVDSLATPAGPVTSPNLSLTNPCGHSGSHSSKTKTSGGGAKAIGSSAAGPASSGSVPGSSTPSGSATSGPASSLTAGASQPVSSSTGTVGQASPTGFASTLRSAMRKPLWLLVAFLVWQALMIGTGVSVWKWRGGGAP